MNNKLVNESVSGRYVCEWPRAVILRIQSVPGTAQVDVPNMPFLRAGGGLDILPYLCISYLIHLCQGASPQKEEEHKEHLKTKPNPGPLIAGTVPSMILYQGIPLLFSECPPWASRCHAVHSAWRVLSSPSLLSQIAHVT